MDLLELKRMFSTIILGASGVTVTLTFVNTFIATVIGLLTVTKLVMDIVSKFQERKKWMPPK
jgi:hypothetical protein